VARIPASTSSFTFRAWLGDGRLKPAGKVRFEPRPAVSDLDVRVLLPEYFGRRGWWRKNRPLYEETQEKGEVLGFAGSEVRVAARFNKPVRLATLELLAAGPEDSGDVVKDRQVVKLDPPATSAVFSFRLRPEHGAYRIHLIDTRDFDSREMPRKTLSVRKEVPPQVHLLREVYRPDGAEPGPLEDFALDGVPVKLETEAQLRLAYHVTSDVPLDRAWLRYRVYKENEEIREPQPPPEEPKKPAGSPPDDPEQRAVWDREQAAYDAWVKDMVAWEREARLWRSWPARLNPQEPPRPGEPVFTEWLASDAAGRFLTDEGVFERTAFKQSIEFHPIPSADPESYPGRREGGGRVHLPVAQVPDLKVGDRLAYYVEVSDRRPTPLVGRSPVRVTEVVTPEAWKKWRQRLEAINAQIDVLKKRQDTEVGPRQPDQ
jgi:hypothetical protein